MNSQLNLLIKKYKKLGGDVNEKEKIDYLKNAMRAPKWDEIIKKIIKKSKGLGFTYEQAFEILIEAEKFIVERDMRSVWPWVGQGTRAKAQTQRE